MCPVDMLSILYDTEYWAISSQMRPKAYDGKILTWRIESKESRGKYEVSCLTCWSK